uniref:Cytochrome P450 n=1 Tax=Oryza punctata TaxID=4537 RepID=A0A0E0LNS7_ORYPU
MGNLAWMVAAAVAAVVASWAFNAVVKLVWRPRAITRRLRAQGVGGPGYRFFSGNLGEIKRLRDEGAGVVLDVSSHDFVPIVQPHFRKWIPLYGRTFVYWFGARPTICLADMSMVRQVLSDRTGIYPKNLTNPYFARLLGKGLVLTDGDEWKRHRKVVHPAFNMDKLKMMTVTMSDCAHSMMSQWESELGTKGGVVEIELSRRFEELTADVISHTAFGSSYKEGKQVFLAQRELQFLAFSTFLSIQIPGSSYIPTKKNLKTWSVDKKVRSMLMDIIKSRLDNKDVAGYGNDLLGLMLEACAPEHGESQPQLSMDEIIAECKTFFFAGHDTTSHLLTWTMFLLSTHPEWQEKLREEVATECSGEVPTGDMLNKLKLVNMFLLETLRLYGPVAFIQRRVSAELELGGIRVPKGTVLSIPIATIHRDKEVWGKDADEFRPERFENGVSKAAKYPNALLSFSSGPRSCIGQNFAMIEAKAVIAMILQRFSFTLSPKYVHAPTDVITLRPKYGLPMILKSLKVLFVGSLDDINKLRADAAGGGGAALDVASHDFIPFVQPHFRQWIPLYGRVFLYWLGWTPDMCVADVELAKQVFADRTGLFPKNVTTPMLLKLFGKGLILANGDEWQRHKKVVHPAFNTDKLKMMTATMAGVARSMVSRWEEKVASHGGKVVIELSSQFEELTADVISHTAFGSSYAEGKQVFMALKELQFIAFSSLLSNLKVWRLDKKVRSTLMEIINSRLAAKEKAAAAAAASGGRYGEDLLGLMLEASAPPELSTKRRQPPLLSMDEIIDECKTFFFAGQETTSHLLSWTMFLLSTHPDWQDKLREEAVRECGGAGAGAGDDDKLPTYDMLGKLKLLNLFLLETLRLYSPVPAIRRRTREAVEMGGVTVPGDTILTFPIATMHRDEEVWGADAGVFDPMRFAGGGGGGAMAKLLSFSTGPRACIGQNFAMVEAKAVVAAILRRFRLELSPEYVHAPTDVITLRPKHGLPMVVTSLHA